MHPNAFLRSLWRMELKPQIFVAMSFAKEYQQRFQDIIAPAISTITVDGVPLQSYRVDLSKSGDSILTDIVDGIAHSQMVLADISSVGKDSETGCRYQNGNVMYEVGIALACRQPAEVLLIRDKDDSARLLFDVSTIPCLPVDFKDARGGRERLHIELVNRLNERKFANDARVQLAVGSLSVDEVDALKYLADLPPGKVSGRKRGVVDFAGMASIPRLLDKHLIRLAGEITGVGPGYLLTLLGRVVADLVQSGLPRFQPDQQRDENKPVSKGIDG